MFEHIVQAALALDHRSVFEVLTLLSPVTLRDPVLHQDQVLVATDFSNNTVTVDVFSQDGVYAGQAEVGYSVAARSLFGCLAAEPVILQMLLDGHDFPGVRMFGRTVLLSDNARTWNWAKRYDEATANRIKQVYWL
jgi:hypothetical protein